MRKCINGEYIEMTPEEIAKFRADAEQAEREHWRTIPYDEAVNNEIRKKYAQRDVEAILNNYLAFPDDEKYISEFKELQKYRAECKAFVKQKKEEYANGSTEV